MPLHQLLRVEQQQHRLDYWQPGDLELTRVWCGVWIFVVATVVLRVGTDSQSAFQNQGEHFTLSVSIVFKLPNMFFASCSDVLCFLFLHVWGSSAAHVRTFCTFVVLCFLIVLVSQFCCCSCFSKNVFFLKMSFHLVWLRNLMVLMILMMLSTRRSSRYHAIRSFWVGSSGSLSGPLKIKKKNYFLLLI